jgi:hypothetical protein
MDEICHPLPAGFSFSESFGALFLALGNQNLPGICG